MNLYLIAQNTNLGNAYSEAVVVAESEEEARSFNLASPGGFFDEDSDSEAWVIPDYVEVTYLGEFKGMLRCDSPFCRIITRH